MVLLTARQVASLQLHFDYVRSSDLCQRIFTHLYRIFTKLSEFILMKMLQALRYMVLDLFTPALQKSLTLFFPGDR